jgi:large subunit ribosomal protein L9
MKVILKEDIDRLGKPGDVVKVSEGYARNDLLPRRKALPATEHNLKNIEQYKVWLVKKQLKNKTAAEEVAAKLAEVECVIERKAGKNNKLFGSVTSQDIIGRPRF